HVEPQADGAALPLAQPRLRDLAPERPLRDAVLLLFRLLAINDGGDDGERMGPEPADSAGFRSSGSPPARRGRVVPMSGLPCPRRLPLEPKPPIVRPGVAHGAGSNGLPRHMADGQQPVNAVA